MTIYSDFETDWQTIQTELINDTIETIESELKGIDQ